MTALSSAYSIALKDDDAFVRDVVEQREQAEASAKWASLQALCGEQRKAIEGLLAGSRLSGRGVFLDFVHFGMSGRAITGSGGHAAERRIRELQEMLAKTETLADLVQAMVSLVHEVNQPLTAIGLYAAGCRNLVRRGRQDELDSVLRQIIEQGDRAWQVTQRIRELIGVSDVVANASGSSPVQSSIE